MATESPAPTPRCRCSYRIATLVVCSCNIVAALYLLRSFSGPLSPILSAYDAVHHALSPLTDGRCNQEQLDRMRNAVSMRKAAEPSELIMRIKEIREESAGGYGLKETVIAKRAGASGMVQRLKELRDSGPKSDKEALEEWRRKKIAAVRKRSEAMKAKEEEYLSVDKL